jgi:hypothetical protein
MFFQETFGQTFRFLAEKQVAVIVILSLVIAPGSLGGQTPHFLHVIFGKEVGKVFIVENFQLIPVVQSGPADGFFRDVKAQRADQMKTAACGSTGSGNVAAVLGDFRLYQYDIQQSIPSMALDASDRFFPVQPFTIVCQMLHKINPKNGLFSTFL